MEKQLKKLEEKLNNFNYIQELHGKLRMKGISQRQLSAIFNCCESKISYKFKTGSFKKEEIKRIEELLN